MTPAELIRGKERLAGICLLTLILISSFGIPSFIWFLRSGQQDFHVFYHEATMVRAGQVAHLNDLHPPFEELLFVPLTHLSYFPAYAVWTFLNAVMLVLSLGMVRKTFVETEGLSPLFLILSVAAFAPAARALSQGQDSVLLLLLVTLAFFLLTRDREVLAGAALGCGLFKFHLVLPLALVLGLRRPRLWLGLCPVAVVLMAIWAMMSGWHGMVDYGRMVVHVENHGAAGTPIVAMPNLRGMFAELFAALGENSGGSSVTVAAIACAAGVLGIVLWEAGGRAKEARFVFAAASVTCILVSYHAVTHDLTLLLPVVLMLFSAPGEATRAGMYADTVLFSAVYASLFLSSWFWPWLNPWWWIPIVIWICWKYGRGRCGTQGRTPCN